jgi:hypothetical protein
MRKIIVLFAIVLSLFLGSSYATDFSLDGLSTSALHFIYHGNQFGWTIFFRDTVDISETLVLNWITKSCTKQIRWYYYNPARGQRLWPLDQDSLTLLRSYNASYTNLSIQWWLFLCGGTTYAIYGSILHTLWWQQYYIIAGVNYNFIENAYLPNYLQSMLFAGGQTFGHIFDSRGGIASLFGAWLTITDPGSWTPGWWWWWWGWGGWGGWWWTGWTTIPTFSGLVTSGLMVDTPKIPALQKGCSVTNSPYSAEVTQAFSYSYSMGITTQCPIQAANPGWLVLRKHIAKMISQFAINVLGKDVDPKKKCDFIDLKNESAEFQRYAKISCQLGIMWLYSNGTPNTVFSPNTTLTRAQFGTILSRLLWWNAYNSPTGQWYSAHLTALKENGKETKRNDYVL